MHFSLSKHLVFWPQFLGLHCDGVSALCLLVTWSSEPCPPPAAEAWWERERRPGGAAQGRFLEDTLNSSIWVCCTSSGNRECLIHLYIILIIQATRLSARKQFHQCNFVYKIKLCKELEGDKIYTTLGRESMLPSKINLLMTAVSFSTT